MPHGGSEMTSLGSPPHGAERAARRGETVREFWVCVWCGFGCVCVSFRFVSGLFCLPFMGLFDGWFWPSGVRRASQVWVCMGDAPVYSTVTLMGRLRYGIECCRVPYACNEGDSSAIHYAVPCPVRPVPPRMQTAERDTEHTTTCLLLGGSRCRTSRARHRV